LCDSDPMKSGFVEAEPTSRVNHAQVTAQNRRVLALAENDIFWRAEFFALPTATHRCETLNLLFVICYLLF
jgi:hypothetical protein